MGGNPFGPTTVIAPQPKQRRDTEAWEPIVQALLNMTNTAGGIAMNYGLNHAENSLEDKRKYEMDQYLRDRKAKDAKDAEIAAANAAARASEAVAGRQPNLAPSPSEPPAFEPLSKPAQDNAATMPQTEPKPTPKPAVTIPDLAGPVTSMKMKVSGGASASAPSFAAPGGVQERVEDSGKTQLRLGKDLRQVSSDAAGFSDRASRYGTAGEDILTGIKGRTHPAPLNINQYEQQFYKEHPEKMNDPRTRGEAAAYAVQRLQQDYPDLDKTTTDLAAIDMLNRWAGDSAKNASELAKAERDMGYPYGTLSGQAMAAFKDAWEMSLKTAHGGGGAGITWEAAQKIFDDVSRQRDEIMASIAGSDGSVPEDWQTTHPIEAAQIAQLGQTYGTVRGKLNKQGYDVPDMPFYSHRGRADTDRNKATDARNKADAQEKGILQRAVEWGNKALGRDTPEMDLIKQRIKSLDAERKAAIDTKAKAAIEAKIDALTEQYRALDRARRQPTPNL